MPSVGFLGDDRFNLVARRMLDRDDSPTKNHWRGTHRTRAPLETLAALRPHLADFGITRVANLTGLDRIGVPVVMVCRPNARSSAVFHGKGIDLPAAKASGVMEAIETWHAEHADLPLRFGSVTDLHRRARLANVEGLPRSAGSALHDALPLLWTEGSDLTEGDRVWVPFEVVHADSTIPGPPGSGCFACSTNGLASGNHYLEAVSHALCEVIERDGMSVWRRLHPALQDRTRLDLESVADKVCRSVIDRLADAGLDVAAWDITTEIGVPAFQAMIVDGGDEAAHVGFGAGCHPVREVALLRALTEAAQVRMTYIVGSREDIEHADYRPAVLAARVRDVRALMRRTGPMRELAAAGGVSLPDFGSEVDWIIARLRAAGLVQVVAVDLSRPGYGIAVVRVVVPGLEGSPANPACVPGSRARAAEARRP
jgi:ribosomal protein S12 methylthiotransferase accessory factor